MNERLFKVCELFQGARHSDLISFNFYIDFPGFEFHQKFDRKIRGVKLAYKKLSFKFKYKFPAPCG